MLVRLGEISQPMQSVKAGLIVIECVYTGDLVVSIFSTKLFNNVLNKYNLTRGSI